MRMEPLRVAFIGFATKKFQTSLASLAPTIRPVLCGSWEEFLRSQPHFQPELAVLFPGVEPLWDLDVPVVRLTDNEIQENPGRLEEVILNSRVRADEVPSRLIGQSPVMARFRGTLSAMAGTNHPILVSGENGTGKDLAASEAHRLSVIVSSWHPAPCSRGAGQTSLLGLLG